MKPLYRAGFAKPPQGLFTHIHTHFGLYLQILGVLHYGGFIMPLYTRGLAVRALYIHTNTQFGLFSYREGDSSLRGLVKPLYRRGFTMGAL